MQMKRLIGDKKMNNVVQNQEYNTPIKETLVVVYLIGSLILLGYGVIDVLTDGYHIYIDGLSMSDQPMLISILIKLICCWLLATFNYFIVILWLQKQS